MHMVHHLVRNPSVVLQNIVILYTLRLCNLLSYGEDFGELVIGDVMQLCAVKFRDDELESRQLEEIEVSVCMGKNR